MLFSDSELNIQLISHLLFRDNIKICLSFRDSASLLVNEPLNVEKVLELSKMNFNYGFELRIVNFIYTVTFIVILLFPIFQLAE